MNGRDRLGRVLAPEPNDANGPFTALADTAFQSRWLRPALTAVADRSTVAQSFIRRDAPGSRRLQAGMADRTRRACGPAEDRRDSRRPGRVDEQAAHGDQGGD